MSARWKTNYHSKVAHLVDGRTPVCQAPRPQGGFSWERTTRGHRRCEDCLAISSGATVEELNELRNAARELRNAAFVAFND
jgi:hypothetical protein